MGARPRIRALTSLQASPIDIYQMRVRLEYAWGLSASGNATDSVSGIMRFTHAHFM
jgi:hypothetical protein